MPGVLRRACDGRDMAVQPTPGIDEELGMVLETIMFDLSPYGCFRK